MNGGSAKECSQCGAAFDASSIVPASRTTRRCPKCEIEVRKLAETCVCGHVFADVRELREQLEDRVRVGWSHIVLGLLGLGASIVLLLLTSGIVILLCGGSAALTARGIVTRRHAKADLAELRGARMELPVAKIVS